MKPFGGYLKQALSNVENRIDRALAAHAAQGGTDHPGGVDTAFFGMEAMGMLDWNPPTANSISGSETLPTDSSASALNATSLVALSAAIPNSLQEAQNPLRDENIKREDIAKAEVADELQQFERDAPAPAEMSGQRDEATELKPAKELKAAPLERSDSPDENQRGRRALDDVNDQLHAKESALVRSLSANKRLSDKVEDLERKNRVTEEEASQLRELMMQLQNTLVAERATRDLSNGMQLCLRVFKPRIATQLEKDLKDAQERAARVERQLVVTNEDHERQLRALHSRIRQHEDQLLEAQSSHHTWPLEQRIQLLERQAEEDGLAWTSIESELRQRWLDLCMELEHRDKQSNGLSLALTKVNEELYFIRQSNVVLNEENARLKCDLKVIQLSFEDSDIRKGSPAKIGRFG